MRQDDRVVAALPTARLQPRDWRRRGSLAVLGGLLDLLREGPFEIRGGQVGWRINSSDGFADWLELVYEAGEPLGISNRLFNRPRINSETLTRRLLDPGCVVVWVDPVAVAERGGTLADLFADVLHASEAPEGGRRSLARSAASVEDEATACAFVYRALKIWNFVKD